MRRILIANRGLCALKFIMSMRDKYPMNEVCIVGLCAPDDIISDYKYLTQVDEVVTTHNDIYMDIQGLVDICKDHQIDAVFPGWGYLSERSDFVAALEKDGIQFMGPTAKTIDMVGNKINSMDMAIAADVPLCGWSGTVPLTNREMVVEAVPRVGLPCVLKDADGGGGKGIRIIRDGDRDTIVTAYNQIIDEMKRVDGEACIFVMELMENCRHIEIQVVGDGTNAMHLFGRDCTTQRRNQKLIEEGPIVVAPDHVIKRCQDSSVRIARMVGYRGLGTVEFLYSPHNDSVTFLEINPRLQVEHIVTELLTDVNLPHTLYEITCNKKMLTDIFGLVPGADIRYVKGVEGDPAHYTVEMPYPKKFVVAARLNAEQPEAEFKPSSGGIEGIEIPNIPNSWSYVSMMNGGKIAGSVDSQFGHLFTIGNSREDACRKMIHLITHTCVTGDVYTTLSFIKNILCHDDFIKNVHTTLWVAHDMFSGSFKSSVLMSNSVPSMSACSELVKSTAITTEKAGWVVGLITQGWFRLIKQIQETTDLINKGHVRVMPTSASVALECGSACIEGVVSKSGDNRDWVTKDWKSVTLTVKSNDTDDTWIICASVYISGRNRILVRFDKSTTQFRIVLHNHDEKYDKMKMQIGNKTVAFQKPVIRGVVVSPISGKITSVFDRTMHSSGESIIEVEAMKMIFPVKVEISGKYDMKVVVGDSIREDDVIGVLDESEDVEEDDGDLIDQPETGGGVENLIESLPDWMYTNHRPEAASPAPIEKSTPRRSPAVSGLVPLFATFSTSVVHRVAVPVDTDIPYDTSWEPGTVPEDDAVLFSPDTRNTGVAGFYVDGPSPCVVIAHHPTYNHGSMGTNESMSFLAASKFAREKSVPRIYVCRTAGASLDYNVEIVNDIVSANVGGAWEHRMSGANVKKWADKIVVEGFDMGTGNNFVANSMVNDSTMYRVLKIKGSAVETLNACAMIASETSLAYDTIPTYTYVRDYAVGIGAYLARLGHRVIQRRTRAPLLLTGFRALNQLLGQDLYVSNDQLGGVDVMGPNGVTHHAVNTDTDAAQLLRVLVGISNKEPLTTLLQYPAHWTNVATDTLDTHLGAVLDGGRWCETMRGYARSTLTGRAYINNQPFAVVVGNTATTYKTVPADPGNVETKAQQSTNSGKVWYPDSAYKTAQTINDANREGLPLLIWVNWRGFSGGTRDMFDEILKFGSMIVDALRAYKQPVYVYLPPGAELRGGAMVVISAGINPQIRMWSDPNSRVGILEPAGAYEVKFKKHLAKSGKKENEMVAAIDLFDVPVTDQVMTVVRVGDLRGKISADCV
jgi:biotin carboxylase/acetyl-CoA carboxylase carboxyltransferase component